VVVVKAPAKHVAKAQPAHRAMALRHHAAMPPKAHRVLKAKATVAVKAATVTVAVAKSNAVIHVLTTAVMAKAVPHRVAHVLMAVAQVAAHKVGKAVKTAAATTVTSCLATLTL
jgi:hypothetical protein